MIRSSSLGLPYQVAFSNGSQDAIADVPLAKGGAGLGFGPHELVEAALATCLTMTVQMAAQKYNIPLTGAHCEVNIDRSVPDTVTLRYTLRFDGPLTAEQEQQLRSSASRCPVARTLTGAVAIEPAVISEVAT